MKVLFYILFIVGMIGCKKTTENTRATVQNISESVYASGVIKSKNQYSVYSTVNGFIQKTLVTEGDFVKKGDPLFVIYNETTKINIENAQLAANFAAVDTKDDRLSELKVGILAAKKKMLNDSILWIRQKGLWAQNIGSKMEMESRELAYTTSASTHKAAIYRYNELNKQLRFAAAQSQKQLSVTKAVKADYTIRSQIDGRVYEILREVGEAVSAQSPLLVMGDAQNFLIELQVDESDISKIQSDQNIVLTMDSYKGQVFDAKVTKINPIMNEKSRTFVVEATFVSPPASLFPNLTTEANIVIRTKENALTIPRNYLLNDSFVVLKNKSKRSVQTGLKDYLKVEIMGGITSDDVLLIPTE